MALFARVCPARKLITEVSGRSPPAGYIVRKPGPLVGCVTVMFTAIAVTPEGIPHCPAIEKPRVASERSAGPPYGPAGFRVSITRQGASV